MNPTVLTMASQESLRKLYVPNMAIKPKMVVAPLLLVLCVVLLSCKAEEPHHSSTPYDSKTLEQFRVEKDQFLRESPDSPIIDSLQQDFVGLKYFQPDSTFAVQARYEALPEPIELKMMTTSGEPRYIHRVGMFFFQLQGKELQLTAYKNSQDRTRLFVPFLDQTTGQTTYSGGRYIDVPEQKGESWLLDFNYAYNPYCAYNESYSCPIVPRQNMLEVAINAGEQTYQENQK